MCVVWVYVYRNGEKVYFELLSSATYYVRLW